MGTPAREHIAFQKIHLGHLPWRTEAVAKRAQTLCHNGPQYLRIKATQLKQQVGKLMDIKHQVPRLPVHCDQEEGPETFRTLEPWHYRTMVPKWNPGHLCAIYFTAPGLISVTMCAVWSTKERPRSHYPGRRWQKLPTHHTSEVSVQKSVGAWEANWVQAERTHLADALARWAHVSRA